MANWHTWSGGSCPTDENALVRCKYASGHISRQDQRAGGLVWRHRDLPFDIVAYVVMSVPDEVRA